MIFALVISTFISIFRNPKESVSDKTDNNLADLDGTDSDIADCTKPKTDEDKDIKDTIENGSVAIQYSSCTSLYQEESDNKMPVSAINCNEIGWQFSSNVQQTSSRPCVDAPNVGSFLVDIDEAYTALGVKRTTPPFQVSRNKNIIGRDESLITVCSIRQFYPDESIADNFNVTEYATNERHLIPKNASLTLSVVDYQMSIIYPNHGFEDDNTCDVLADDPLSSKGKDDV